MLRIARETLASVRAFLVAAEEKGVPVDLALAAATPASVEAPTGRSSEESAAPLRAAKSMGNLRAQRRPTPTTAADRAPASTSTFPARPPKAVSRSAAAAAPDPGHLTLRSASALSLHLSTLHDSLLSTIAALIGHVHSHARSTSPASSFAHLIDLTREGIERVRDVLVVVEKVAARLAAPSSSTSSAAPSPDEMQTLAVAREKLYEATTALVAAARTATSPREGAAARKRSTDSSASIELARERKRLEREHDDEERQALLGAATGVLRAGGDCVGAVRGVVQQLSAGGEDAFELTLPRPKTGDELAEEHRRGEEAGRAGAAQDGAAVDDSPAGSVAFADADEDAAAPSSSVGAEAEQRAVARPPSDRTSPRKGHAHTLSMLGRKATSLSGLRGRYEGDGGGAAPGVAALTLEEAPEPEDEAAERRDEDGESACTGDSEQTASSPVLPRPASFASTYSPIVDDDGRRRSIKTSTSSLSPVDFAPSPAPSSPSFPEHHVTRPNSLAMHRGKSSESAHSASSSRATAHSLASSSALTSGTAETSPRSSIQSPPSLAAALLKAAPRTSLGSVNELARTSPSSSPNATPRGSVSSGSTSATWFLERDYLPQEISFNADGHVSGGTLRCLVERMTLHDTTIEAAFSNTFLLCFRMFTTPLDLANLLWARFDLVPPRHPDSGAELSVDELKQWTAQKLTPVRLRIFNLFKTWVESYWLHGPDGEIVDGLLEWCAGRLKAAMPSASTRLADLVRKRVVAAQQDEAAAIAAKRESSEDLGLGFDNGSSASLASRSASPSMSMNGSTLSLAVSNPPPVAAVRNGFAGGGLNRMQSTDRLKAGKALVPFSSLATGSSSSSSSSSSPAIDAYSPSAAAAASAPPPVVTKSLVANLRPALSGRRSLLSSVTEIDALELARQLTIMESRVYCSIRADELLGAGNGGAGAGSRSSKHVSEAMRTPNVRKMSSLSTRLTGWITEAVLGEQDQKRRTGLLKYFIKLGEVRLSPSLPLSFLSRAVADSLLDACPQRLLHLANYNALFAVFTALNSSTISRLRKTWDGLAPKYRSTFETLRKATDHGRNYAEYRHKVRQAVPPCLPFVGVRPTLAPSIKLPSETDADDAPRRTAAVPHGSDLRLRGQSCRAPFAGRPVAPSHQL